MKPQMPGGLQAHIMQVVGQLSRCTAWVAWINVRQAAVICQIGLVGATALSQDEMIMSHLMSQRTQRRQCLGEDFHPHQPPALSLVDESRPSSCSCLLSAVKVRGQVLSSQVPVRAGTTVRLSIEAVKDLYTHCL